LALSNFTYNYTTLHWENKHGNLGAICAHDINPCIYCTQVSKYIPKTHFPGSVNGIDIKLVFKNNTADSAGSMFLGGI